MKNQIIKFGIGQDSHRFKTGRKLILGGLYIPNHAGCDGNSDADVILHALCNALASSVGKGSISTYADKLCKKNIKDSKEYVKVAFGFIEKLGFKINNISISIEAKEPKLEKHFQKMKKNIAKLVKTSINNIGITATTGDGLTSFGRGKGIQVFVLVSIIKC